MVVNIDKQTGDLVFDLPPEYTGYAIELRKALYEEFAFESLNKMVLSRMNRFVDDWFKNKGIEIHQSSVPRDDDRQGGEE